MQLLLQSNSGPHACNTLPGSCLLSCSFPLFCSPCTYCKFSSARTFARATIYIFLQDSCPSTCALLRNLVQLTITAQLRNLVQLSTTAPLRNLVQPSTIALLLHHYAVSCSRLLLHHCEISCSYLLLHHYGISCSYLLYCTTTQSRAATCLCTTTVVGLPAPWPSALRTRALVLAHPL